MSVWIKQTIAFVWLALFCFSTNASDVSPLQKLQCGTVEAHSFFTLPPLKQAVTILMIGSSSTSGVGAGDRSKAYPARTAFHLNTKENGPTFHVIAKGIGGEKAKAAVQRFPDAIKEIKPDILVWQAGTNDALGKIPLDELTLTLQKGLAIAQTHGLPLVLIDPQFFPRILNNQHYEDTVKLIQQIATSHGLPVVKRYQRMKQALAIDEGLMTALMAKDRFHMSQLGHECLALDLASTLRNGDIIVSDKD